MCSVFFRFTRVELKSRATLVYTAEMLTVQYSLCTYTTYLTIEAADTNFFRDCFSVKRLKTRDAVMDIEDLVLAGTKQRLA